MLITMYGYYIRVPNNMIEKYININFNKNENININININKYII